MIRYASKQRRVATTKEKLIEGSVMRQLMCHMEYI